MAFLHQDLCLYHVSVSMQSHIGLYFQLLNSELIGGNHGFYIVLKYFFVVMGDGPHTCFRTPTFTPIFKETFLILIMDHQDNMLVKTWLGSGVEFSRSNQRASPLYMLWNGGTYTYNHIIIYDLTYYLFGVFDMVMAPCYDMLSIYGLNWIWINFHHMV